MNTVKQILDLIGTSFLLILFGLFVKLIWVIIKRVEKDTE